MATEVDLSWQDNLIRDYPGQFPPNFHIECASGWEAIIREMCRRVDILLEPEDRKYFKWSQIKEKYGTLRAYNNGPDFVEDVVDWAEAASERTCEICGRSGRSTGRGWLAVRCDDHATS